MKTSNETKTYYFNTGVKPWNSSYMGEGDIYINNERHIPFVCDDVPDNVTFAFACDDPNLHPESGYLIRPIIAGGLHSKFAYFSK